MLAPQGGADLIAVNVIGSNGITLMARDQVNLLDVVTRNETFTNKVFMGGFRTTKTYTAQDRANVSYVASSQNIQVMSLEKGIYSRGAVFLTPQHIDLLAFGDITQTASPLYSYHKTVRQGLFVRPQAPLISAARASTGSEALSHINGLAGRIKSFGQAEGTLDYLTAGLGSVAQGLNVMHQANSLSTRKFGMQQLGLTDQNGRPNIKVEVGYKKSITQTSTVSPGEGGLYAGSASYQSLHGNINFLNSFPVQANDLLLYSPNGHLNQQGFCALYDYKNEAFEVAVGCNIDLELSGSAYMSQLKTQQQQWIPQVINSNNMTIFAKGINQDAGLMHAHALAGQVGFINTIARQDTSSTKMQHISVSSESAPTYQSMNSEHRQMGTLQGFNIQDGHNFIVNGSVTSLGAHLSFGEGATVLGPISHTELNDYHDEQSFNTAPFTDILSSASHIYKLSTINHQPPAQKKQQFQHQIHHQDNTVRHASLNQHDHNPILIDLHETSSQSTNSPNYTQIKDDKKVQSNSSYQPSLSQHDYYDIVQSLNSTLPKGHFLKQQKGLFSASTDSRSIVVPYEPAWPYKDAFSGSIDKLFSSTIFPYNVAYNNQNIWLNQLSNYSRVPEVIYHSVPGDYPPYRKLAIDYPYPYVGRKDVELNNRVVCAFAFRDTIDVSEPIFQQVVNAEYYNRICSTTALQDIDNQMWAYKKATETAILFLPLAEAVHAGWRTAKGIYDARRSLTAVSDIFNRSMYELVRGAGVGWGIKNIFNLLELDSVFLHPLQWEIKKYINPKIDSQAYARIPSLKKSIATTLACVILNKKIPKSAFGKNKLLSTPPLRIGKND